MATLVISDVVLFLAATVLAGLFVRQFWVSLVVLHHIAIPAMLTALLSVLVFWQLGLYRASFAMAARDEFYHTVAALLLASALALIEFSLFPMILNVACRRDLRAAVRDRDGRFGAGRLAPRPGTLALAYPRRIAVVGHPSGFDAAEDALHSLPNVHLYRIAVSDLDDVAAMSPEGIESLPWFRHAAAWGCDMVVCTEILAPSMLPYVLRAAERMG